MTKQDAYVHHTTNTSTSRQARTDLGCLEPFSGLGFSGSSRSHNVHRNGNRCNSGTTLLQLQEHDAHDPWLTHIGWLLWLAGSPLWKGPSFAPTCPNSWCSETKIHSIFTSAKVKKRYWKALSVSRIYHVHIKTAEIPHFAGQHIIPVVSIDHCSLEELFAGIMSHIRFGLKHGKQITGSKNTLTIPSKTGWNMSHHTSVTNFVLANLLALRTQDALRDYAWMKWRVI